MEGFEKEVLRRLPLAHGVLSIFAHVLNEPFLDSVFDRFRKRCYEGILTFSTLVYLVRDALLVYEGHGLPSFQRAQAAGELPVLIGSVYPKLARVEVEVSKAFLRESSMKMFGLFDQSDSPVPKSLAAFQVVAFDGHSLKEVRGQLKALRPLRGKFVGGKIVVAQDVRTGLALAMDACEDADRNDVPLVPDVIRQVREMFPQWLRLWMGDRQFCDLNLFGRATENGEHFLIRMNRTLGFTPDPARPAQKGVDSQGRSYVEEWGWVGGKKDKRRRYVRRITLPSTNKRKDDLILLTDLLDETLYPAQDLLDAYALRWGIEKMFQKVSEVFSLRQLIGGTPKATIFQGAFCLVIYNAIQVMRSYVAQAGNVATEDVSTAKLFDDVQEELIAHSKLGSAEVVVESMQAVKTQEQMKDLLIDLLGDRWEERWRKTQSNPRTTRGRTERVKCGRSSVFKVLQQHRAKRSSRRVGTRQRR
jgi:hypothetical protein